MAVAGTIEIPIRLQGLNRMTEAWRKLAPIVKAERERIAHLHRTLFIAEYAGNRWRAQVRERLNAIATAHIASEDVTPATVATMAIRATTEPDWLTWACWRMEGGIEHDARLVSAKIDAAYQLAMHRLESLERQYRRDCEASPL